MENNCNSHQAHEEHLRRNDARLAIVECEQSDMKECLQELKHISRTADRRLEQVENRIAAIEAAPAKKWNHATNYIMTAVLGAVVGYLLKAIGLY